MKNLHFDAVIFDLDGVITDTAAIHSAAWKQMFDEYLHIHVERTKTPFREFTHEDDYLPFVDGKPRYKGVASFLSSRDIQLPYGDPGDAPDQETVCGLGNRKNQLFNEKIFEGNITVFQGTVDFIHELRAAGIRIGLASSSKNTRTVLEVTKLLDLFETRVDGVVSADLGLKGKPEPDIFTTACDNLGVFYDRAVVVEDAISGVQAGAKGNFGLVIGVAREDNLHELKINGADLVVVDMAEINIQTVEDWFTQGLDTDQWSLNYADYTPEKEGTREALLTVGNGYFGTRGAQEETRANDFNYPGTYIAGLYNRLDSQVGGRIVSNEDLVNCPNWLPMTFRIGDGDWFDPNQVEFLNIHRRLDFRTGVLQRSMVVRDAAGQETRLTSQRFASMDDPHLAAMQYSITPLNYDDTITVQSELDGDIINAGVARYRDLSNRHLEPVQEHVQGESSSLLVRTNQSEILIAQAARLSISLDRKVLKPNFRGDAQPGRATTSFEVPVQAGNQLCVDKRVSIYTSHQHHITEPLKAAQEALEGLPHFEQLLKNSAAAWDEIWQKADVQIEGDRTAQKLIRLHIFHTFSTCSPHNADLDAGIPARGLHGEAYRGHIFWDDMYVLPLIDLHYPKAARSALMYRYNRLPGAREYARKHGYQGAMFPWQSGRNGGEETQTLHLNPLSGEWGADYSTLQRHVSLSVAVNVWEYLWINDDQDFLENFGAELFLEICRFWASKATFNQKSGLYDIAQVMGPDEFHEKYPGDQEGGLKNNTYTNLLVSWAFERAFELIEGMSKTAKNTLFEKLQISDDELARWRDMAHKLKISLSAEGILEQFRGYFDLKELDWAYYRDKYENIHRMDRILKAEGKSPDSYKVAKQADTLMAFYVLSEQQIERVLENLGYDPPDDMLRRNFHYYLPRTSHGSTLSRLVHAYLAYGIGDRDLGWTYYFEALKSDFIDIQGGTTKEGIHAGVMAGTVLFALRAFAGLSWVDEQLKLKPNLPETWRSMKFNLGFKGARFYFDISKERVKTKLVADNAQSIFVDQEQIKLDPNIWGKINQ
jgi:beta-phosphoglucomutase family hydrolase